MIALLVDIGNSRIKWRIAHFDDGEAVTKLDAFPRWITTEQALPVGDADGIEALFRASMPRLTTSASIEVALIANVASEAVGRAVAGAVTAVWPAAAVRSVQPEAVTCGLANGYRDPLQLGVDRWLAAVAAHALYPGRSILVCTFGTATTIDLVEQDRFVGGLILPGVDTMLKSLADSTARLPARAGRVVDFADCTADAITSGVMAAQVGAIESALVSAQRRAGPAGSAAMCIIAGGAAARMAARLEELAIAHRIVHDLVLRGLAHSGRTAIVTAPT